MPGVHQVAQWCGPVSLPMAQFLRGLMWKDPNDQLVEMRFVLPGPQCQYFYLQQPKHKRNPDQGEVPANQVPRQSLMLTPDKTLDIPVKLSGLASPFLGKVEGVKKDDQGSVVNSKELWGVGPFTTEP